MKLLQFLLDTYKEEYEINLKESLTKSQNVHKTITILKRLHEENFYFFEDDRSINAVSRNIEIEKVNQLLKTANNLGWFPSFMDVFNGNFKKSRRYLGKWNPEILKDGADVTITFEAKYDEVLENIPKYLYHVAPTKNAEKILKLGLVPKSRSKKAFHPERVYLAKTGKNINTLVKVFHELSGEKNFTQFRIDTELIPGEYLKLYKDPNFDGGFYTVNNIPPVAIKKLKDIEL